MYGGPIRISSTDTLQAIAKVDGHSTSASWLRLRPSSSADLTVRDPGLESGSSHPWKTPVRIWGSRWSPTTASSLSPKLGSLLTLKLSIRCS